MKINEKNVQHRELKMCLLVKFAYKRNNKNKSFRSLVLEQGLMKPEQDVREVKRRMAGRGHTGFSVHPRLCLICLVIVQPMGQETRSRIVKQERN